MNKRSCLLAVIVCGWPPLIQAENIPLYQQSGYTLEKLSEARKLGALDALASYPEFWQLRGIDKNCETIYDLVDPRKKSMGYGAICNTRNKAVQHFFCWDASGQHFGYAPKGGKTDPGWIGESILHGCGGGFAPYSDPEKQSAGLPTAEWPIHNLGRAKRRPPITMLKSDIEYYGFSIPLGYCEKVRYISLGWDRNTYYAAICEINEEGKEALICFDNLVGHFALFTRFQDNNEWVKNTVYRHCWETTDSLFFF